MLAFLAWMCLSLGTTGLVCGLALMGWSMNACRQELWDIGDPIVFAGQIALVLGLILQLDRLWRNSRWAAEMPETAGKPCENVNSASTWRSRPHNASSDFHSHWADGAEPETLLDDLKSRLDLLAAKLLKE